MTDARMSTEETRGTRSAGVRGVLLLVLAMAGAGCDWSGKGKEAAPQPGARAGYLTGKLADARGGPLSDVTVSVFGFSDKGEPVSRSVFVRGPAREYALELPPGKYNTPTARIEVDFNERRYNLPLGSADNTREWTEQRNSASGLVRDFVWRISGPTPGGNPQNPTGYWGATVHFDKQGELGDYANVEVTLTPDGPLIDGSEGDVKRFERRIPWKRHEDHYLLDVPIGRYVATVKQTIGARPRSLRVTCYTIDPARPDNDDMGRPGNTAVVEFECVEGKPGEFKVLVPNLIAFPGK
jgi:hypothetical protein